MEKLEPSYNACRNVKWYSQCGKVWQSLKILNITLPDDPAIPLLGIYPRELKTRTQTSTCTRCIIAPDDSQQPKGGNGPSVHQ